MRVLQPQRARTPPYSRHATCLREQLTPMERVLARILPEFVWTTLALFFRRNQYDAVITIGHRMALCYGVLRRLFGSRSAHIVKELFLHEGALASAAAQRRFRWALGQTEGFIVNCSAEEAAYSAFLGLPEKRFRFIPWPSNLDPTASSSVGEHVLAAGRSFRDWPALFEAARHVKAPFVVVAEARAVAGLPRPDNIILACNIAREPYLDYLRRARLVVVPLRQTVRSIGQAVLLEALSLGKPVVTADVPGVVDYVRHEANGLLYAPGDSAALACQINRLLADADLERRLAENGRRSIAGEFNRFRYAERMVETVEEFLAITAAVVESPLCTSVSG